MKNQQILLIFICALLTAQHTATRTTCNEAECAQQPAYAYAEYFHPKYHSIDILIQSVRWNKSSGDREITLRGPSGQKTYRHDVKIWLNNVKEWNWQLTNTHHSPGIQKADLDEFIKDVDIIILTRGMDLVLRIPQETIDYAKQHGKQVFTGQTVDMVKLYNKLIKEGKKVGGLFHLTC